MYFRAIPKYGIVVDLKDIELYGSSKGIEGLTQVARSTITSLARTHYRSKDKSAIVKAMRVGIKKQKMNGYWFDLEVINDILSKVNPKKIQPKVQRDHIRKVLSEAGLSNVFDVLQQGNKNQIIARRDNRSGLVPFDDYVANFLKSDKDNPWNHGLEDEGPVYRGCYDVDSSSDDAMVEEESTDLGSRDSSDSVSDGSELESSDLSESSDDKESEISLSSSMEDFQIPKKPFLKRK